MGAVASCSTSRNAQSEYSAPQPTAPSRMVKVTLLLLSVFFLSWLPYHVTAILSFTHPYAFAGHKARPSPFPLPSSSPKQRRGVNWRTSFECWIC